LLFPNTQSISILLYRKTLSREHFYAISPVIHNDSFEKVDFHINLHGSYKSYASENSWYLEDNKSAITLIPSQEVYNNRLVIHYSNLYLKKTTLVALPTFVI
jgi:hypothetical protein